MSRLSNHYPERFIAYAFFSVPFVRLVSAGVLKEMLADSKRRYGYDTIGYWTFLAEDGSEGIIESNVSISSSCHVNSVSHLHSGSHFIA